MDFDDLIRLPVRLFREHPDALEAWQGRLRYLLVDEYQDTNGAQYEVMKLLAGPMGRFTAVGDDDQAIYAWRGADVENLRRLKEDYPRLKIIPLTQNYRSSQRILRAANSVIANNPRLHEKNLWSELGLGDHVELLECRDDRHEAETVVMRISAHKFEHRTRFADYAILYRGNHQARLFEEALREAKMPYQLSGGQSFFDKAEIKDLIAYLRLIANQDDDPAFIRAATTPRRGIGAATLERLGDHAGQRHVSLFEAAHESGFQAHLPARQLEPLMEFCDFINRIAFRAEKEPAGRLLEELLAAIRYEEWLYDSEDDRAAKAKWENVRDFVEWLAKKGEDDEKTLIDLNQTLSLMNLLEGREETEPDAVRLSTLHAAKGLEYPHVYLVGVEEEILPHRECLEGARLEEERRLMYVGITRARSGPHHHLVRQAQAGRRSGHLRAFPLPAGTGPGRSEAGRRPEGKRAHTGGRSQEALRPEGHAERREITQRTFVPEYPSASEIRPAIKNAARRPRFRKADRFTCQPALWLAWPAVWPPLRWPLSLPPPCSPPPRGYPHRTASRYPPWRGRRSCP
jgi:ATP-dependent DNA helicase Rep